MSTRLNADDVASFLQENPEFFQEHAELFANLRVPHPHETRAISLGERQIMVLRTKTKDLEWKLSGLIHNATGNEKISKTLNAWCCRMLAEDSAEQLPGHIVRSLSDLFDLETIALRLWDTPAMAESEFCQDVSDDIRQYAQTLTKPYCGPMQGHEAAGWLGTAPASLAIVALHPTDSPEPFGLLVLGSSDPERFTSDMGTEFLSVVSQLASAGLCRLRTPSSVTPETA